MRAIVTGTGSIAARHVKNLRTLYPAGKIAIVARAAGAGVPLSLAGYVDETHADIESALQSPADLAVIATPAIAHVDQALACAKRGIATLIEKPLAMKVADGERLLPLAAQVRLLVGYCLRYHPLFIALEKQIAAGAIGRIYNLRAEVGQYLPNWRPGTDYRRGVTAQKALGGGALMELSHEIDLVRALFGMPNAVTAMAQRISELETDVEDVAEIVSRHRHGGHDVIASIHLDLFRLVQLA